MCGPRAPIGFTNAGDWAPEIIMVFRFPNGRSGVRHGNVYQGQQARELNAVQSSLVGNLYRNLIIEPWRRAQAWRAIIRPESADKCLLFRALRGRIQPIATKVFCLVVRSRVCGACHGWRRRRAELGGRGGNERTALAPVRAERERDQTYWILAPVAR